MNRVHFYTILRKETLINWRAALKATLILGSYIVVSLMGSYLEDIGYVWPSIFFSLGWLFAGWFCVYKLLADREKVQVEKQAIDYVRSIP